MICQVALPAENLLAWSGEILVSTRALQFSQDKVRRTKLSRKELTVPVHLFDVIILRNRQFVASFYSAALQHVAAIRSRHSFAKTMHAYAPANFWLISSFWHSVSLKSPELVSPGEPRDYTLSQNQGQTKPPGFGKLFAFRVNHPRLLNIQHFAM